MDGPKTRQKRIKQPQKAWLLQVAPKRTLTNVMFIPLLIWPLVCAHKVGLIILPDYWGFNGGRIRSIADHLAQSTNAMVVDLMHDKEI